MPTTDELQAQINALQSQLNSILGMADDDYIHQYSGEEIDAGITAAGNAVRYDLAQSLTTAQQAQARGNIAAAPDGYGLGGNGIEIPAGADLNSYVKIGRYAQGTTSLMNQIMNLPDAFINGGIVIDVFPIQSNYVAQVAFNLRDNKDIIVAMRLNYIGAWQPWEYVNPPMVLGVEYRTTERYLGKPVYTTIVNFGAISAGTNTIAHNIASVGQMVGCELIDVSGYVAGQPSTLFATANKSSIYIEATGSQYVGRKIYVRLRYTKSTD